MKQHLLEMFSFNQQANQAMVESVARMENPAQAAELLAHLVNSQDKWLRRIQAFPQNPNAEMDWWLPTYPITDLAAQFERSSQAWIDYLSACTEAQIEGEVSFRGRDDAEWRSPLKDIALQLIFHSFHHRAQVQMLLREEGITPEFIDYIGSKYYRVG